MYSHTHFPSPTSVFVSLDNVFNYDFAILGSKTCDNDAKGQIHEEISNRESNERQRVAENHSENWVSSLENRGSSCNVQKMANFHL
jgi:hypothetical protein